LLQQILHPVKLVLITTKSLPENITKFIKKIYEHPLAIHPGIGRMHKQLKANGLQWPGMKKDFADVVTNCYHCQLSKTNSQNTKLPMMITDTAKIPFEKILLDFVGSLPLTINGNQHALMIQDNLT